METLKLRIKTLDWVSYTTLSVIATDGVVTASTMPTTSIENEIISYC